MTSKRFVVRVGGAEHVLYHSPQLFALCVLSCFSLEGTRHLPVCVCGCTLCVTNNRAHRLRIMRLARHTVGDLLVSLAYLRVCTQEPWLSFGSRGVLLSVLGAAVSYKTRFPGTNGDAQCTLEECPASGRSLLLRAVHDRVLQKKKSRKRTYTSKCQV